MLRLLCSGKSSVSLPTHITLIFPLNLRGVRRMVRTILAKFVAGGAMSLAMFAWTSQADAFHHRYGGSSGGSSGGYWGGSSGGWGGSSGGSSGGSWGGGWGHHHHWRWGGSSGGSSGGSWGGSSGG